MTIQQRDFDVALLREWFDYHKATQTAPNPRTGNPNVVTAQSSPTVTHMHQF